MPFSSRLVIAAVFAVVSLPARSVGAGTASCTHPLFNGAVYTGGGLSRSMAIGDLDGVNGPDIALVSQSTGNVSVLLNQGDGTFAAVAEYAAGTLPQSVAIGDLDGVNGPDLAVANLISQAVTVLLNQGDGVFGAAVSYAAGGNPRSVAIGDLDGVNGPDLAVANSSDEVWVLLNQGDGTFAAAAGYGAGDLPVWVAIGDLDGINGPDLATANLASDDVSVLLNRCSGGDAPGTSTAAVLSASLICSICWCSGALTPVVLLTSTATATSGSWTSWSCWRTGGRARRFARPEGGQGSQRRRGARTRGATRVGSSKAGARWV